MSFETFLPLILNGENKTSKLENFKTFNALAKRAQDDSIMLTRFRKTPFGVNMVYKPNLDQGNYRF